MVYIQETVILRKAQGKQLTASVGFPANIWTFLTYAHKISSGKVLVLIEFIWLGCGYGYNLTAIKERFPEVQLYTDELDTTVSFAECINRANLNDNTYDDVILSHILEHFKDPISLLASVKKQVNQNGVLIIEVPNDVEGIYPLNIQDEPHLIFFTENTLKLLFEKAGILRQAEVFTAGPDYKKVSKNTLPLRVKNLVRKVIKRFAPIRRMLELRREYLNTKIDFSVRNSKGVYLRAVVKFD